MPRGALHTVHASAEAWGELLNRVRDRYSESDLVLMDCDTFRDVLRTERVGPVEAARLEVQWQVQQDTHPLTRQRNLAESVRTAARETVQLQQLDARIQDLSRRSASPRHTAAPQSTPNLEQHFNHLQEAHKEELLAEQGRVRSASEQHDLHVKEELWQLRFQQDVMEAEEAERARRAANPQQRAMTAVLSPMRGDGGGAGILSPPRSDSPRKRTKHPADLRTCPDFEVPKAGPPTKTLTRKPRLGTGGALAAASDPNSCARLRHHVKPAGGIGLCAEGWGGTTEEGPAKRPQVRYHTDRHARGGDPSAISPASPSVLRTSVRTKPSVSHGGNPNDCSLDTSAATAKRTFPSQHGPTLRQPVDEFVRGVPDATACSVARRNHNSRREWQPPTEEGRSINIPRKGAKLAGPAGRCDPNPIKDDNNSTGKCLVKQTAPDSGVMHPWVGDLKPQPFQLAQSARRPPEGVMPWDNSTHTAPEGKLHLRDPAEGRAQSPASTRRLQAGKPADCGVMPGSCGWRKGA